MILVPVPSSPAPPRPAHPRPGAGVLATANAFGWGFSAPDEGQTWNHPFRPALSAFGVSFLQIGTVRSVNGIGPIVPTISVGGQDVPMLGKSGSTPTPLKLDPSVQNANGESWIALEVTPDAAHGELLANSKCQLVHFAPAAGNGFNDPPNKTLGRCPITQILWNGKTPIRAIAIVTFNLVYQRIVPAPGAGDVAHYFL